MSSYKSNIYKFTPPLKKNQIILHKKESMYFLLNKYDSPLYNIIKKILESNKEYYYITLRNLINYILDNNILKKKSLNYDKLYYRVLLLKDNLPRETPIELGIYIQKIGKYWYIFNKIE